MICHEHEECDMEECLFVGDLFEPANLPPVKGEARQARLDNGRKMVVTNRSALMLGQLARDGASKRRQRRRKRGAQ